MSTAQEKFYWSLWSMARKRNPEADRKALHKQLGLPDSHHAFNQEDFDGWKSFCLAEGQPSNYHGQVATAAMPRTRRIWLAEQLCRALGEQPEYALATLARMNRERGMGAAELALEDLDEVRLDKVLTALRKACRRSWPTKADLLRAISEFCRSHEIDDRTAYEASAKALNTPSLCWPDLHYDKLLIAFAQVHGEGVQTVDPQLSL